MRANDQDETVVDDKTRIQILHHDRFSRTPISSLEETLVFEGRTTPLAYARHYNIEFQCLFDMTFYPFDTQTCRMHLQPTANAGKYELGEVGRHSTRGDIRRFDG